MGNAKSTEQVSNKRNASLPRLALPDDRKTSTASKKYVKRMSTSSQGSGSQSGRTVKPALPLAQRQIVKSCMDNAKDDIAERIYRRVIEKREDFRNFVESLPVEQRMELADNLREFLNGVVERLMDSEEVQRLSQEFGGRHVQFRSLGFRPDFFATTADAVTTECVFLDAAVHQASDTLTAWSTLTSLMFSSVRDGYYNEMRKQRRASNCITKPKTTQEALSIDENNQNEEGFPRKGSRGGSRWLPSVRRAHVKLLLRNCANIETLDEV
uniref:Globin family profile domain-containing protein n=1 Tax=Ascaris suum TaxID=6253 RepID=F1LD14_ASCSU